MRPRRYGGRRRGGDRPNTLQPSTSDKFMSSGLSLNQPRRSRVGESPSVYFPGEVLKFMPSFPYRAFKAFLKGWSPRRPISLLSSMTIYCSTLYTVPHVQQFNSMWNAPASTEVAVSHKQSDNADAPLEVSEVSHPVCHRTPATRSNHDQAHRGLVQQGYKSHSE